MAKHQIEDVHIRLLNHLLVRLRQPKPMTVQEMKNQADVVESVIWEATGIQPEAFTTRYLKGEAPYTPEEQASVGRLLDSAAFAEELFDMDELESFTEAEDTDGST